MLSPTTETYLETSAVYTMSQADRHVIVKKLFMMGCPW